MAATERFLAPLAWVGGAWAKDVLLEAGEDGRWCRVETVRPELVEGPGGTGRGFDRLSPNGIGRLSPNAIGRLGPDGVRVLGGPVLPGLVDAHSHAFQRAMAGLAERSGGREDDFWSWRDRMYGAALRISPQQLEAVAAFLYAELLLAGYTQVCEFHYLHNAPDGQPYADPLELSHALVRAAKRVGIGLTLLPTLYMRSGFAARGLREDQRRFASTPESVLRIARAVGDASDALVSAGVAVHSLRAADEGALRETVAGAQGMPIHIHLAEQRREVEDCLLEHGVRPVEWLLSQAPVDARWNMVHATQCNAQELTALRDRGAAIVLCPSTEANLGDGIFDLRTWLGCSGNWSIGSDSHVSRSWREELRLLEYSQRLQHRERNVAARAALTDSTAAALFQGALQGGSAAAGVPLGGIAVGQRADFVVVDRGEPALCGVADDALLDAIVFSSPERAFRQVFVAGREARVDADRIAHDMRAAMEKLWS